jgi:hypothetical protein
VREKKAAVDQAAAPLSLRAKMLMSAYLPECRADGMADVRDLKSRGDFPRVGSTPTPGTIVLLEAANNAFFRILQDFLNIQFCNALQRNEGKIEVFFGPHWIQWRPSACVMKPKTLNLKAKIG